MIPAPTAKGDIATGPAMSSFRSILFRTGSVPGGVEVREPPDFFHDLSIDQIVEAVVSGWVEYDLKPLFHTPLKDTEAVIYRQDVMQDISDDALMRSITSFSQQMRTMRKYLKLRDEVDYCYEVERWFLNAAQVYCDAIRHLSTDLRSLDLKSEGMRDLREYLAEYVASPAFGNLEADVRKLTSALAAIRYELLIDGGKVTVLPYDGDVDYAVSVEATFEKFRRGTVKDYRVDILKADRLNHVEVKILERVAWLNPETFSTLSAFSVDHAAFLDETVRRFDREVHFYVAYLGFARRFVLSGLKFCYPMVSDTSKEIECLSGFDLALAHRLSSSPVGGGGAIVPNDFTLKGPERMLIVTGPNHGGKTTFARMFGQLHYLAALGCPVPAMRAKLVLFDQLFVHFEREEDIANLRGKLQDDLVRVHELLGNATPRSIIIMNELFASTTLKDAVYLSRKVMTEMSRLDLLAVCVTFLDELASFDEKTVSLVSVVDPRDPTVRTFKVERRPADGLAYALAIAEKYHVTYDWIERRISA